MQLATTPTAGRMLSGMIAVYKPAGMISKDVSRRFIRKLGRIHIGHVGTLDPLAEGVLPILFGRATRLQDYLLDSDKSYEFDVTLGITTDTLDAEGAVVAQRPWEHVTREDLLKVAEEFLGAQEQIPPIYSAIKFLGKPLYEYARSGKTDAVPVERLKRRVFIHDLTLLRFEGRVATFTVSCSKGTYVRTLAGKIGEKVGSCGMVSRLVRTFAAGVPIAQAKTLQEIDDNMDDLSSLLIPLEQLKLGIPVIPVEPLMQKKLLFGQRCEVEKIVDANADSDALLVDEQGQAFALGRAQFLEDKIIIAMKRGLK